MISSQAKTAAGPNWKRSCAGLQAGDTIVITKLDRIARSVAAISGTSFTSHCRTRRRLFVSLGKPGATPPPPAGSLMITVLGGIAEFERELIRERCEEGIKRAKRKGTKFGRPIRPRSQPAQAHRRALHCRRDDGRAGARVRVRGSDDLAGAAIAVGAMGAGLRPPRVHPRLSSAIPSSS